MDHITREREWEEWLQTAWLVRNKRQSPSVLTSFNSSDSIASLDEFLSPSATGLVTPVKYLYPMKICKNQISYLWTTETISYVHSKNSSPSTCELTVRIPPCTVLLLADDRSSTTCFPQSTPSQSLLWAQQQPLRPESLRPTGQQKATRRTSANRLLPGPRTAGEARGAKIWRLEGSWYSLTPSGMTSK